jgi:putative ABC transport system permease protein
MTIRRRFRSLFGRDARRDVDDELSFHIEMRAREMEAMGESRQRAEELARQRFGDYAVPLEECIRINERQGRRMARSEWLSELGRDIGYAMRSLRRRPGFTAVAVLTLGLGIGATSSIFSVVNGVLLDSLPFADAERLYVARMVYPDGARYQALSAPDFMSVVEMNRSFEQVSAFESGRFTLQGAGDAREVRGSLVSEGLLSMLGLELSLGRAFSPEDHVPGGGDVAILEHGFWQREFGGSADVLGRRVRLLSRDFTVVGVLAPAANLPYRSDVLAPLSWDEEFSATAVSGRRSEFLTVLGRARGGLDDAAVNADMARMGAQLATDFPSTNGRLTMDAVPLRETIVGDVRRPLYVLLGAVGLVLLVACANVANLLLARASARQDELAVRAALGAGRGRLVRQLVTESLVLGVAGGALGLFLAWAGTRALVNAQPTNIPRLENIGVDGVVVGVTIALALLTGLLFGVLPALQATRRHIAQTLRDSGRGGDVAGQRARSVLIVAEMALAVILLVGAALLIRSFVEMTRVNPGFEPQRAIAFRMQLERDRYPQGENMRAFVDEMLAGVAAVPGVTMSAATTVLPVRGLGSLLWFEVENEPPPPDDVNREIAVASATPGYFATISTPIVAGRDFGSGDHADAPRVAIINEAAARFWFPGVDPIGRRVSIGESMEIVGVVADVLQRNASTPVAPQLFAPYAQSSMRNLQIVARTAVDPLTLAPALREVLRSRDPAMPVPEFIPLQQVLAESLARPRFYTALLTLFAGISLVLAAIGVFGVMSYAVAQRTREISIRMALGARRAQVIRMVVGRSMLLAAAGLLLGAAGALVLGRVVSSQLYNVGLTDPLAYGAAAAALGGAALLASYLPARRASRLDPGMALRE